MNKNIRYLSTWNCSIDEFTHISELSFIPQYNYIIILTNLI